MRILIIGKAGVGKTRLVVSSMNLLKGKTIFFSELPKENVLQITPVEADIDELRPDVDILELVNDEYDNIIIDHWLRIKDIESRKTRSKIFDIIERSKKNWIILAHTLKGKEADSLDNGRWTSGLDTVIDIGFGLFTYHDLKALRIIKDRYWLFKDKKYIGQESFENLIKQIRGDK